jgi:amino acid adenylation domain-containing protein
VYRYLLFHALERHAQATPDHDAVRFSGSSLTYGQLSVRSSQLAHALREAGVCRGDRVGIYMNKCLDSIASVYGIMKAGAAYVPLDPFAPVDRLSSVIEDCGIRILLSNDEKIELVREVNTRGSLTHVFGPGNGNAAAGTVLPWGEIYSSGEDSPPGIHLTEQDLAYILYTSGSTGVPKGIMHTHRSGLSFAEWAASTYGLVRNDRLSNHAPLHFDLSTFDIFAGHLAGATTVIIPEGVSKFPASVAQLIERERISVWYSVPFALIQMLQRGNLSKRDMSALRWILFAGEPFPPKHLRNLMMAIPHARFSNLYGPTETNVCTYFHVAKLPDDGDESIPIGVPCGNVETLVTDGEGVHVLPGEAGELLIRGGVVMRGYWGQPEKTEECFFRREVMHGSPDLFYRTGDLVRLNSEGEFEYLGRKDRQIKSRGYRIELDEIEVALLAIPGVQEAAVFPIPDEDGSNQIEGAVVLAKDTELTLTDILERLAERLPPYSIPRRLWFSGGFPRTSTGKVDRQSLRRMAMETTPSKLEESEH